MGALHTTPRHGHWSPPAAKAKRATREAHAQRRTLRQRAHTARTATHTLTHHTFFFTTENQRVDLHFTKSKPANGTRPKHPAAKALPALPTSAPGDGQGSATRPEAGTIVSSQTLQPVTRAELTWMAGRTFSLRSRSAVAVAVVVAVPHRWGGHPTRRPRGCHGRHHRAHQHPNLVGRPA